MAIHGHLRTRPPPLLGVVVWLYSRLVGKENVPHQLLRFSTISGLFLAALVAMVGGWLSSMRWTMESAGQLSQDLALLSSCTDGAGPFGRKKGGSAFRAESEGRQGVGARRAIGGMAL